MADDREIREVGAQVSAGTKGTFVVEIDYKTLDGITYTGKLYFKMPSVMQTMQMGAHIASFIQGQYPSGQIDPALIPDVVKDLAEAVVTIEMLMSMGPEWAVKIRECVDYDLPLHVANRYRAERFKFRNAGKTPAASNSGAGAGADPVLVSPSVPTTAD